MTSIVTSLGCCKPYQRLTYNAKMIQNITLTKHTYSNKGSCQKCQRCGVITHTHQCICWVILLHSIMLEEFPSGVTCRTGDVHSLRAPDLTFSYWVRFYIFYVLSFVIVILVSIRSKSQQPIIGIGLLMYWSIELCNQIEIFINTSDDSIGIV